MEETKSWTKEQTENSLNCKQWICSQGWWVVLDGRAWAEPQPRGHACVLGIRTNHVSEKFKWCRLVLCLQRGNWDKRKPRIPGMVPSELGAHTGSAHLRDHKGTWSSLSIQLWEMSNAKAECRDVRDGEGGGDLAHACLTLSIPFTCLSHRFPPYSYSTAGPFAYWGEILPKLKTWFELRPSMRLPWDSRVNRSVLSELLSHFMNIYYLKWMASLMWLSPCLTEA